MAIAVCYTCGKLVTYDEERPTAGPHVNSYYKIFPICERCDRLNKEEASGRPATFGEVQVGGRGDPFRPQRSLGGRKGLRGLENNLHSGYGTSIDSSNGSEGGGEE